MTEVVLGALVRDGRVLLGHRSPAKRAFPDVWDLPGGVVEAGESELAALARELHEELGVEIVPGSAMPLRRVDVRVGVERLRVSAWLVAAWCGTPSNAAPEEHVEVRWFRVEDLPDLALEEVRAALASALGPDRERGLDRDRGPEPAARTVPDARAAPDRPGD